MFRHRFARSPTADQAVDSAPPGGAVLILADGYPHERTPLPADLYDRARARGLRLYVEYPSHGPGIESGKPVRGVWERAVVSSDAFGEALPRLRILGVHGCRAIPARSGRPDIVLARVAGFDTALFGLPERTWPLLYEPDDGLIVATTKLSSFVAGRYAPTDAWAEVWRHILCGLMPGVRIPALRWTPTVAFLPMPAMPGCPPMPKRAPCVAPSSGSSAPGCWSIPIGRMSTMPTPLHGMSASVRLLAAHGRAATARSGCWRASIRPN
ncbi:MAG: hypothetical protein FJX72_09375, partial [Armatimonadetes bacterium]|nr:hypothetical protein [Armatimonadota bacterium]